ncbi:MAG TPA: caspase family protein, partial [Thermoanaerobaculia bacterium]|nr:caspase family protein [Thermoanaerobaculia bacterium]
DRYRRLLGELDAAARSGEQIASLRASDLVGKAGPSIHFVRPDVLATRGPALAPVPADGAEAEVVGRVEAPLGLVSLLADGEPVEPGADGYFRLRVPVEPGATVRFVAIDRASRRAEAELRFVAEPARVAGSAPAPPPAPAAASGRRGFALVVANGAYRNLAELRTARADGESVAEVLRDRYGFQTRLLVDATFLDTLQALSEIGGRVGAGDDLLVYFAGHGRMAADGRRGYWLPVDARADDASTWIPNEAIARLLGTFAAGRILVVSDSCYAGTLASSGLDLAAVPAAGAAGLRSRLVITSGGLQPVLDEGGDGRHSIFARALLSVLQLADRPLGSAELFSAVAARVAWRANRLGLDQTPQLAPIRWAGHESGELVFAPEGG